MEELYDISEVCAILGTTSRTLRFYEDKGLISCTKMIGSSRRKYTVTQLDEIRKVMTLRAIGLSVSSICDYMKGDADLNCIVDEKIAHNVAAIRSLETKHELLSEAKAVLASGGNIFDVDIGARVTKPDAEREAIVQKCTDCFLGGDISDVLSFFSERMREYGEKFLLLSFRETAAPLGSFIKAERIEGIPHMQNIVFHYLRYEKIGLRIKYVFRGQLVSGLWFDYYENGEIK